MWTARRMTSTHAPVAAFLNYPRLPPPGKRTGRNINGPHARCADDLEDLSTPTPVLIGDARTIDAFLAREGFELRVSPSTAVPFVEPAWRDPDTDIAKLVVERFYEETRAVVAAATGADRVVVFDHTVRKSWSGDVASLNSDGKSAAGAVPRVHCDYTAQSGPVRMEALLEQGVVTRSPGDRKPRRYCMINVWRSLDMETPVLQRPLAVCDASSVHLADTWDYVMLFPDRTGHNLALHNGHVTQHRWWYFPRMTAPDEALVFKVFDSHSGDGGQFVFHTAFDDPTSPPYAPPRRSVEARTVAIWD